MKKLLALLLAVVMLLSFAACSNDEEEDDKDSGKSSSENSGKKDDKVDTSEENGEKLLEEYQALVDTYLELMESGDQDAADAAFQDFRDMQNEITDYANALMEEKGEEAQEEFLEKANEIGNSLYDNM